MPTLDAMRFEQFAFGSIRVDGTTYDHDLVIHRGRVRKRKKGPSKRLRSRFGHTPLWLDEDIPWDCRRLVIGSGAASWRAPSGTNAIPHVTC